MGHTLRGRAQAMCGRARGAGDKQVGRVSRWLCALLQSMRHCARVGAQTCCMCSAGPLLWACGVLYAILRVYKHAVLLCGWCLCAGGAGQQVPLSLATASSDGTIKLWDLRKMSSSGAAGAAAGAEGATGAACTAQVSTGARLTCLAAVDPEARAPVRTKPAAAVAAAAGAKQLQGKAKQKPTADKAGVAGTAGGGQESSEGKVRAGKGQGAGMPFLFGTSRRTPCDCCAVACGATLRGIGQQGRPWLLVLHIPAFN